MNVFAKVFILIGLIWIILIIYFTAKMERTTDNRGACGRRRERMSDKPRSGSGSGSGSDGSARSYRLVGGVSVNASTWPWQVSIMHRKDLSSQYLLICGGVIINKDWILTAASCVPEKPDRLEHLSIKAGSADIYKKNDKNTQELNLAKIIVHHSFNPITLLNNIALLKLNSSLVFSAFVDQICIPNRADVEKQWNKYGVCHITGYGENSENHGILQEAEVELISTSKCNHQTWHNYKVSKDTFCAGGSQGGPDGCEGNKGGPLSCYAPSAQRYVVSGIRVHTQDCGVPRQPNIYVRVSQHFNWIWNRI